MDGAEGVTEGRGGWCGGSYRLTVFFAATIRKTKDDTIKQAKAIVAETMARIEVSWMEAVFGSRYFNPIGATTSIASPRSRCAAD